MFAVGSGVGMGFVVVLVVVGEWIREFRLRGGRRRIMVWGGWEVVAPFYRSLLVDWEGSGCLEVVVGAGLSKALQWCARLSNAERVLQSAKFLSNGIE